jgi:hypothetical protein
MSEGKKVVAGKAFIYTSRKFLKESGSLGKALAQALRELADFVENKGTVVGYIWGSWDIEATTIERDEVGKLDVVMDSCWMVSLISLYELKDESEEEKIC